MVGLQVGRGRGGSPLEVWSKSRGRKDVINSVREGTPETSLL